MVQQSQLVCGRSAYYILGAVVYYLLNKMRGWPNNPLNTSAGNEHCGRYEFFRDPMRKSNPFSQG
jgi:hypothetical protein